MKREEKNQQMRRRIMDSALAEFSKKGYGAGSINTICASQDLSKGIVYHYFHTKDDLFLACVEECFSLLTESVREKMGTMGGGAQKRLEIYFNARMNFFEQFPVYQQIFCEAVISPPDHLREEIQARKEVFDKLNIQILEQILEPVALRPQVTREGVINIFRLFQDFINAYSYDKKLSGHEFETHEQTCRKAIDILLYGVVERKERD